MVKWICVYIIGLVVLIVTESSDETTNAFNGFMIFILIMHLIAKFFNFVGRIIDSIIEKYENHKENRIMEDKYLDKLEKLTKIKLQGGLSDREFEEQKSKILKK